ncbi:MAG: phosphohydrolase, partial [Desulfosalsimonas sp.]
HHHPRDAETLNFKVVWDADRIANIEDAQKEKQINGEDLERRVKGKFFTRAGEKRAGELFLQSIE